MVEGRKLRFTISATDANPNQIKYYYLVNAPAGAYMDPATGVFNWTPEKPGTYTFFARVSDSGSPVLYDQKQITVKVTQLQYYTLQVGITGSGRVTREPLQEKYADGTKVTLTAIPSEGYVFTGWSGDATGTNPSISLILDRNKKVTANFTATPEEEEIKLDVLNAETNKVITSLTEGLVLNLAAITTNKLNIQATTNPDKIKSVKFELSGKQSHTIIESRAPYLLFGDVNGNANDWVPATGKYTIKATPFSEAGGKGNSGKPIIFHFSVINKPLVESERYVSVTEQFNNTGVPLVAYPTPTLDGHITVALPAELKGKFNYSLLSAVGSKLTSGENNANNSKVAKFDFSRQMSAAGIYYLRLENAGFKGWIKLVRQ
ncbi:MAG: putative Ig domain-containing protein [Bacteroidota bacterium]|nr:putative Ig domain-containing protein [Bacteroidota bacterium]